MPLDALAKIDNPQRFFAQNREVSAVVAAVIGADAENYGPAASLAYDVWYNRSDGPVLVQGVKPMGNRPPYDVLLYAVFPGTPVIPVKIRDRVYFHFPPEWPKAEECPAP
jgi:hypothetical protein